MSDEADRTIVAKDGRVLLFSCERFVNDIVMGDACFICGASPLDKGFNDEHIIPKWLLRRFDLFEKEIILPNGERKRYTNYRVPCCVECNSLLGAKVETPISQLLKGDFATVMAGLNEQGFSLLFVWISLLFFKVHLKDRSIRLEKDRRKGDGVVGDAYDWTDMHHIHAVARSPYTEAELAPEVIGSLRVFEIEPGLVAEEFDYVDFTLDHTFVIRIGCIGIVATLNDAGVAERAWSERLAVIDGPLSELQLREVGAMFACANRGLIHRPRYSTLVFKGRDAFIVAAHPADYQLLEYDPEGFGHALLFAVRNFVDKGAVKVEGARNPDEVASAISTGRIHFLFDEAGAFQRSKVQSSSSA